MSAATIADIYEPFTGAQFIRYRMNDYVNKNLAGVLGYPKPRIFYYELNVERRVNGRGIPPVDPLMSLRFRMRCGGG